MALIDSIGVDLITYLIIIFTIIIIYLSWLSTSVRELPFPANLLVIERRSRRLFTTNISNGNLNLSETQNQSANSNQNLVNEESSNSVDGSVINSQQSNIIRNSNLELVNEMVEQALVENLLDGNLYSSHHINLMTSNSNFSQNSTETSIGIDSGNGQATSSMNSNFDHSQQNPSDFNTENSKTETESEELINILIKFVNEKEMKIQAKPSDTILLIKKAHFGHELSNNKIVRFIYQGQFLADKNTIKYYNIKDQTTIHCHITSKSSTSTQNINQDEQEINSVRNRQLNDQMNSNQTDSNIQNEPANENNENPQPTYTAVISIDLNHLLLPLLAVILGTCWYFRLNFKHLFSPLSTLILIIFTFLYAIFLFNNLQSSSSVTVNNILVHRRVLHIREDSQPQSANQN